MNTSRVATFAVTAAIVLRAAVALPQTPDDIVEKHLAAMGGRAALEKITSRITTGTITVSTPGGDLSGTIEVYNKAPNKSRTLVKIDASQLGVGQIVQDQRFDGTSGYAIDSLNGNREITGGQADIARANTFPSPLIKYKDAGAKLELLGREKVGDRDAFVLRLTPKSGPPTRIFIDAETYVLAKTVLTVNVPQLGTDVEQTSLVSDYRDVDGVKVPYQIRSINQFQTVSVTTTKVEQNVPIDEKMFSKPE
jgi:outer membrane lipoprotein-sorting protein